MYIYRYPHDMQMYTTSHGTCVVDRFVRLFLARLLIHYETINAHLHILFDKFRLSGGLLIPRSFFFFFFSFSFLIYNQYRLIKDVSLSNVNDRIFAIRRYYNVEINHICTVNLITEQTRGK